MQSPGRGGMDGLDQVVALLPEPEGLRRWPRRLADPVASARSSRA
jgi:hypothetical protein